MIPFIATALAVVVLTWVVGWWGVVVAALAAGALLWRRRGGAWLVALAAFVAWGALLVVDSIGGRFTALAEAVAGVMRVPVPVVPVVALLFAALLAWSAAVLGGEIARLARAKSPSD